GAARVHRQGGPAAGAALPSRRRSPACRRRSRRAPGPLSAPCSQNGRGAPARARPARGVVMTDSAAQPGGSPASLLADTLAADAGAMAQARDRQERLTKPSGSLGALEDLSVRLAGVAGDCPPPVPEPAAVAVFAADHGVHAQGVTPWPQDVTAQMVANFLAGG